MSKRKILQGLGVYRPTPQKPKDAQDSAMLWLWLAFAASGNLWRGCNISNDEKQG